MIVEKVLKLRHHDMLRVDPADPVIDVARRFEQKRTGIAMVCDTRDHLVGVVSLGDIVHAIGERGAEVLDLPVRMIMTADVATCEPGEDINGALAKMTERGIRYLPVVENGKLTGFIEKPDALEVLYEEAALDFAQLRNYVFKTGGRY